MDYNASQPFQGSTSTSDNADQSHPETIRVVGFFILLATCITYLVLVFLGYARRREIATRNASLIHTLAASGVDALLRDTRRILESNRARRITGSLREMQTAPDEEVVASRIKPHAVR